MRQICLNSNQNNTCINEINLPEFSIKTLTPMKEKNFKLPLISSEFLHFRLSLSNVNRHPSQWQIDVMAITCHKHVTTDHNTGSFYDHREKRLSLQCDVWGMRYEGNDVVFGRRKGVLTGRDVKSFWQVVVLSRPRKSWFDLVFENRSRKRWFNSCAWVVLSGRPRKPHS